MGGRGGVGHNEFLEEGLDERVIRWRRQVVSGAREGGYRDTRYCSVEECGEQAFGQHEEERVAKEGVTERYCRRKVAAAAVGLFKCNCQSDIRNAAAVASVEGARATSPTQEACTPSELTHGINLN